MRLSGCFSVSPTICPFLCLSLFICVCVSLPPSPPHGFPSKFFRSGYNTCATSSWASICQIRNTMYISPFWKLFFCAITYQFGRIKNRSQNRSQKRRDWDNGRWCRRRLTNKQDQVVTLANRKSHASETAADWYRNFSAEFNALNNLQLRKMKITICWINSYLEKSFWLLLLFTPLSETQLWACFCYEWY